MADKPAAPSGRTTKQDVLFYLGVLGVLFFLWVRNGGYKDPSSENKLVDSPIAGTVRQANGSSEPASAGATNSSVPSENIGADSAPAENSNNSRWYGKVTLSSGNASSETDPNKEYIQLYFNSDVSETVSITGWRLENNHGTRIFNYSNGQTYRGITDKVFIPTGAIRLLLNAKNTQSPITLSSGGSAVIYSGKAPNVYPAIINSSFLKNSCSGYLTAESDLFDNGRYSCPDPSAEPGIGSLDENCRDFIQSDLRSCSTDSLTDEQFNRFNLTGVCRSYLTEHFSYSGCVTNHQGDSDFYGNIWYVFLGKNQELWLYNHDEITLYDAEGKYVDSVSW